METLKRIQEDRKVQRERLGNAASPERMATDAADVADSSVADSVNESQPCVAETSLLQVLLCVV